MYCHDRCQNTKCPILFKFQCLISFYKNVLFHLYFQIIYIVCERLLELAERKDTLSSKFAKSKAELSVDLKRAENGLNNLQLVSNNKNSKQEASNSAEAFPSNCMKNVLSSIPDCDKVFSNSYNDEDCEKETELVTDSLELNRNKEEAKFDESDYVDDLQYWWKQMTETEVTCLKAKAIAIALCDTTFEDAVIQQKNDLKVC